MIRVGCVSLVLFLACNSSTIQAQEKVAVEIVGSNGNRITDVEVMWWHDRQHKKATSKNGKFSLPQKTGLLAVRKDGYQYTGIVLDEKTPSKPKLKMLRNDEIESRRLKVQPIPISPNLREKLTKTLRERCLQDFESAANPNEKTTPVRVLTELDSTKALELLEAGKFEGQLAGMVKQTLIERFARTDVSKAIPLADGEENPMFRSMLVGVLARSLDADHPQRATIESQWVDAVRNTEQPGMRLAGWAMLAEHYLHTDRPELVKKIVSQQMDDVKKLPAGGWSAFPRSLFAAFIVEDDPKLAGELIEGAVDYERSRALGRLAFHCCRTNPQQAKEFLDLIVKGQQIGDPYHIKVAHRMASVHPQKAIELAKTIADPKQRGWALGMVSRVIAKTNPDLAKGSLDLVISSIEEGANAKLRTHTAPAELLAGLMPVAEEFAPERLHSMLWQSVWLTLPKSRWSESGSLGFQVESTASALARYDSRVAQALYRSPADKITDQFNQLSGDVATNRFVLAPEQLAAWFETQTSIGSSYRGYEAVAKLLSASPTEFWDSVSVPFVMQWPTEAFEEL